MSDFKCWIEGQAHHAEVISARSYEHASSLFADRQYWSDQATEENWFDVKCRWGKGVDICVMDIASDYTINFRVYARETIVFDAVLKGSSDV